MAKSHTAVSSGRLESNVDQHLTNNTVCQKFFWSSRPRFLENVSIGEKGLKRGSWKTVCWLWQALRATIYNEGIFLKSTGVSELCCFHRELNIKQTLLVLLVPFFTIWLKSDILVLNFPMANTWKKWVMFFSSSGNQWIKEINEAAVFAHLNPHLHHSQSYTTSRFRCL